MHTRLLKTNLIIILTMVIAQGSQGAYLQAPEDATRFYEASQFAVIGKYHNENSYQRFASKYKGVVRDPVWQESQSAAGINIRFRTNAARIVIRWKLHDLDTLQRTHSPGNDGVDLYAHTKTGWQYVNTGIPKRKSNEDELLDNVEHVFREYLLNLPLYNGVDSLSIGVDSGATITKPEEPYLINKKPVVYYGSSIAQGASASRPGMAYTNMLERKMDRPFINFGFSGEGTYDLSVGMAMSEIDAALYVIDCNPNSKAGIIHDSCMKLVRLLKEKRPDIPILLVEQFYYESVFFSEGGLGRIDDKRRAVRAAYEDLKEEGIKRLYYKTGDGMIGNDHEGTADGVHPNDVGMERFAKDIMPVIAKIIDGKKTMK